MTLRLTEALLVKELTPAVVDRGRRTRDSGRIRTLEVVQDGTRVSGSIAPSISDIGRRQPYGQTISMQLGDGRLRIKGYCTCPVGFNCKHVAALLLEFMARSDTLPEPRRTVVQSAREPQAAFSPPPPQPMIPPPAALPSTHQYTMPQAVADWLDRMVSAAAPAANSEPPSAAQKVLLYILDHSDAAPEQLAITGRIRIVSARQSKDGKLVEDRRYDNSHALRLKKQGARFVTVADDAILRDLEWLQQTGGHTGAGDLVLTPDAAGRRVLDALLATGRLRYGGTSGLALRAGEEVAGLPVWTKGERGEQRLAFKPVSDAGGKPRFDHVLALSPPHYIDRSACTVGPIATDLPAHLAIEIAKAPAVPLAAAAHVKEMIRQKLGRKPAPAAKNEPAGGPETVAEPAPLLPLPEAADNVEMRIVEPVPRLEMMMTEARLKQQFAYYTYDRRHSDVFPLPVARLAFDYAGEVVPVHAPANALEKVEDGRVVIIPRDHKRELAASERLTKAGVRLIKDQPFTVRPDHARDLFIAVPGKPGLHDLLAAFDDPGRFIQFSAETVPMLAAEGWSISYQQGYPYQIADGNAEWWGDVGEGSGIDWFSFELGVAFEGHRINLVPQLVSMLSNLPEELLTLANTEGQDDAFTKLCGRMRLYHNLPDGRLLPLPGDRLAPMLKSLLQLVGPRGAGSIVDGKISLHRAEAGALADFVAGAGKEIAWAATADRLIKLGRDLKKGRSTVDVTPPTTFKASLRGYQSDGLAWLDFLRETGFGGVLADDMGLGKTVQALAFLAREKAEGRLDKPALILSPTSVLPNWQAEAEKFAPELRVLALRGQDRHELFGGIPDHDLVLTTYPLLARDHEVLLAQEFHIALLDEAQAIKNPKATVTGIAHRINARHRFALTGTPLENNLGEVWSLFEFLSPGLLGNETTFRRTFRTPIEKHGDPVAQAFLSRRLKPFMLRRTKAEVATELPPKTEIIERVRLEGGQRDLYETVRSLMHEKVRGEIAKKGLAKSHIIVLDALLKLRQICCDPRLLKLPQAKKIKGSAKLERLMEMIPEMVAEGRRILLFSQFTSMLDLIKAELDAQGLPYVTITGDTDDRATPVKEFQAGKVPLFLLSLKAGGTGLNLTAADTVIHYDPWWNPAVENQATDRAYRIGQDKPVFVYKMIVEEGIEEAIELLKARKAALAEALFAGGSKTPMDLSEADISALFAPLDKPSADKRPVRRAA